VCLLVYFRANNQLILSVLGVLCVFQLILDVLDDSEWILSGFQTTREIVS
jgi:hypothetical protein